MTCLWMSPGLLATGALVDRVSAVQDGPVNFFVVEAPSGLVCFDAGWRIGHARNGLLAMGLNMDDVTAVFLTHLHWDHARGHRFHPKARVYVGDRERPGPFVRTGAYDRDWTRVSDGEEQSVAGLRVRTISTPGHTSGSVSYLVDDRLLFTGDALRLRDGAVVPFASWFNNDATAMDDSIRKLARLADLDGLFTGHSGFTRDVDGAFNAWRSTGACGGGASA